jgi:DNA-binding NarL/FixJ family response regulator
VRGAALIGTEGIADGDHRMPARHALTTREIQLLNELAKGKTNKEVAETLGLSAKTVGNYVSAILVKLDARSRTDAVTAAIRLGLVDLSRVEPVVLHPGEDASGHSPLRKERDSA